MPRIGTRAKDLGHSVTPMNLRIDLAALAEAVACAAIPACSSSPAPNPHDV
jgi:hypothetical protein